MISSKPVAVHFESRRPERAARCCTFDGIDCLGFRKQEKLVNIDASSVCSGWQDLDSALEMFRGRALTAMRAAAGQTGAARCEAACGLIEAIVRGVDAHLPEVNAEGMVHMDSWPGSASQSLLTLVVRFASVPIVGEVATRSRVPMELVIDRDLKFAVQAPGVPMQREPLLLRASGLKGQPLADVLKLHAELKEELGDDYRLKKEGFFWWEANKERFPLQDSKFRRIYESLHGSSLGNVMNTDLKVEAFWGYIAEEATYAYNAFAFHVDESSGDITVTAEIERPPPRDAAEVEHRRRSFEFWLDNLRNPTNRAFGARFVPSSLNFGKMICDTALGKSGADATKITKLFSHALWWGPGGDGWHQLDHTWQLVDKKDVFGVTVAEQGRIIWTLPEQHSRDRRQLCQPVNLQPSLEKGKLSLRSRSVLMCILTLGLTWVCYLGIDQSHLHLM